MKNFILIPAILLLCSYCYAQELKKGHLIGIHTMTINLDPDVTLNQFLEAFETKFLSAIEKNFPGWKAYLVKGRRGVDENQIGIVYMVENEAARDIYFNEDGSWNEKGTAILEKVQPITNEIDKLGTWTTEYTDWVVQ